MCHSSMMKLATYYITSGKALNLSVSISSSVKRGFISIYPKSLLRGLNEVIYVKYHTELMIYAVGVMRGIQNNTPLHYSRSEQVGIQ